ncbi:hypothetical protein ACQEVF_39945 [Nonomuraea polychroma]|uniref:hypothetical protein n=1 Tax=Nonomuraea polychroma TaxID=46176 RepID=UPI003D91C357
MFVDMALPQLRGYNHYAGEKEIKVDPHNGHEGGESVQTMERIVRARKALG